MEARLHEKYRPRVWAEVLAQPRAVGALQANAKRVGWAGQGYWIVGGSGTGKGCIARLIAAEVADDLNIQEVAAGDLTPAAVGEFERNFHRYGLDFGGGGKYGHALIVNEAHRLGGPTVARFNDFLEKGMARLCVVIFTTTNEGERLLDGRQEDISPLISRCFPCYLARRDLAVAFAKRAKEIAVAEGLDGQPESKYLRLVQDMKNNMRLVLSEIQAGRMSAAE